MSNTAAHVARMRARNPFQLIVTDYAERSQRRTMLKPHQLGLDSWVETPGTRTFGFKTQDELDNFKRKWKL